MPKLEPLHERTFAGKPLKSFKVYNDPFGANEVCIELTFVDGQVECVGIGPGRPEVVSSALCYEGGQVSSGGCKDRNPRLSRVQANDLSNLGEMDFDT